jgi:hypothetical protein
MEARFSRRTNLLEVAGEFSIGKATADWKAKQPKQLPPHWRAYIEADHTPGKLVAGGFGEPRSQRRKSLRLLVEATRSMLFGIKPTFQALDLGKIKQPICVWLNMHSLL